jgi:guanosine-3',5'-bis(diphosphate) 3'-pyrophosphohydrolase
MENGRAVDAAEELERAIALAVRAHHGQRYPTPEVEPYILHPLRVMLGVSGARPQAAAVLHDVLEDTAVTAEDLREANLSSEVVDAVIALTRRSGQTYEQYIEQVAGNAIARRVKLADLADNLANNQSLTRRPDVVARIERYERAIRWLQTPDVAS